MMLLASLTAISAATDRIPAIVSLFDRTVWEATFGPFFPPLVVGGVLLIVEWALTRSHDRYFAIGWMGLPAADAGIMKLSTTQTWDGIALLRISWVPRSSTRHSLRVFGSGRQRRSGELGFD